MTVVAPAESGDVLDIRDSPGELHDRQPLALDGASHDSRLYDVFDRSWDRTFRFFRVGFDVPCCAAGGVPECGWGIVPMACNDTVAYNSGQSQYVTG